MLEAGHRCVVPNLPGFGRSSKPPDDAWYSYENHTAAITSLFEELDLTNVALVVQDWDTTPSARAWPPRNYRGG